MLLLAVVWAVALGALAWTKADEPTLNRVQFQRADAILHVVLLESADGAGGRGVRATVIEAIAGGRGPVPTELTPDAEVTIRDFPPGVVKAGRRAAVPVRRVAGSWTVAAGPEGLPSLVYSLSNPGDWSDLKAAAEALSAGRPPYR
ncbi:hypothetical protein CA12_16930 [Alienimonas californiensis]|uniref:Uncharacterized protein n=1 Tax=Alienimonas californiensis TaxID=2527989 RepID=A0A517P8A0_9PLAN|nr:hypothetical protein CA12_16930 [Alienimonas californiensis]